MWFRTWIPKNSKVEPGFECTIFCLRGHCFWKQILFAIYFSLFPQGQTDLPNWIFHANKIYQWSKLWIIECVFMVFKTDVHVGMRRVINVDEAKDVCQDRSVWRSIAYLAGSKAWCTCIFVNRWNQDGRNQSKQRPYWNVSIAICNKQYQFVN